MTLSPRAIEVAVKAIDKLDHRKAISMADLTRQIAEAAITAYLDALAVDGLCLVPSKPIGYFNPWNDYHGFQQVHVDFESDPDVYPFYADQKAHDDLAKEKAAASTGDSTRQEKI